MQQSFISGSRLLAASFFLTAIPAAQAAPLLAVDYNDRTVADTTPPNTPTGFQSFVLGTSSATATQSLGAASLTLNVFDDNQDENLGTTGIQNGVGAFDDRDRTTPSNTPSLAQIYDDFIFAGGSAGFTGGIDIVINSGGGLAANTLYNVSIYAFDSSASTNTTAIGPSGPLSGLVTADYRDGNAADAVKASSSFNATVLPITDDQYKFTGQFITDGSGNLLIKARRTATSSDGVRLNGLEIDVVPEPASLSLIALGGLLTLRRKRA